MKGFEFLKTLQSIYCRGWMQWRWMNLKARKHLTKVIPARKEADLHLLMSISLFDWNPIAPWLILPLMDLKSRAMPKSAQRRSNSWVNGTPLSRLDLAGRFPEGTKTSQHSTQTSVKKMGTARLLEARTITCPLVPWLTLVNRFGLTLDGLKRCPCFWKFNASRRYLK